MYLFTQNEFDNDHAMKDYFKMKIKTLKRKEKRPNVTNGRPNLQTRPHLEHRYANSNEDINTFISKKVALLEGRIDNKESNGTLIKGYVKDCMS